MRSLWISTLLIPVVLAVSAAEATQEDEISFQGAVEYVGPVLADSAVAQRLSLRSSGAGLIDVYNTWTSFQRVKLKNNLTIVGHSYQICQDRHREITFAALIYAADGPIEITSQHKLKGGPILGCDNRVLIPTAGYWLHTCTGPTSLLAPGFYKTTSTYAVRSGGNGNGKETAWFDLFARCN